MYHNISDLDRKNARLKNLAVMPGFNLLDKPIKIKDSLQINNRIIKDNDIINETIFTKFFGLIDKTNKKMTKKRKLKKAVTPTSHKTTKRNKRK